MLDAWISGKGKQVAKSPEERRKRYERFRKWLVREV